MEELFSFISQSLTHKSIEDVEVCLQSYIKTLKRQTIIYIGSSLLNSFVQLNYTGPPQDTSQYCTQHIQDILNGWSLKKRSLDEECWYELVRSPYLLYISQLILNQQYFDNDNIYELLWCIRCLYIEQGIISIKSNRLWLLIKHLLDKVQDILNINTELNNKSVIHLEVSHYYLYYNEYELAQYHIDTAIGIEGISVQLSGALGKRTRYQQNDIAQLICTVNNDNKENTNHSESRDDLPKDILLNDDTLLTHIQYTDEQESGTKLTILHQSIILGICYYQKTSRPINKLTNEELEAYINCVLMVPQSWCVHSSALYIRSILQKTHHRTMERSMTQLQELLDCYNKVMNNNDRLTDFYYIQYPPVWEIEKQLADILVSMGASLSALEIYERLHLWESVIHCYISAGRQTQAQRCIRERMNIDGETVLLWCLLGDVTQDPKCYEKAWILSNEKSSRAQKSLGLHYLSKEMYEECVKCLHKSVQINPLQEGVWFTLGYCSEKINDYILSVKSYRHCVTLEPDNAEAWNNLASSYLKNNDKLKAFNSFQEALKCNYENWKIWENYLTISLDIGNHSECIRAYHRLMDLRPKHLDTQVLMILTSDILQLSTTDHNVIELKKKLGELLGRTVAETTGSSELWEIISQYHLSCNDQLDRDKGVIELQKAQRTARQVPSWEREDKDRNRIVNLTLKYSTICREIGNKDSLVSARMSLQNVAKVLKGMETVPVEQLSLIENELQLHT